MSELHLEAVAQAAAKASDGVSFGQVAPIVVSVLTLLIAIINVLTIRESRKGGLKTTVELAMTQQKETVDKVLSSFDTLIKGLVDEPPKQSPRGRFRGAGG